MSKKMFYHYRKQILKNLERTYDFQPMNCIKYIISNLRSDEKIKISNAYHWTIVEADKIRYSRFAYVFYKYNIYETLEHDRRKRKYLRRMSFSMGLTGIKKLF